MCLISFCFVFDSQRFVNKKAKVVSFLRFLNFLFDSGLFFYQTLLYNAFIGTNY